MISLVFVLIDCGIPGNLAKIKYKGGPAVLEKRSDKQEAGWIPPSAVGLFVV